LDFKYELAVLVTSIPISKFGTKYKKSPITVSNKPIIGSRIE
jgi:hypothetical protein